MAPPFSSRKEVMPLTQLERFVLSLLEDSLEDPINIGMEARSYWNMMRILMRENDPKNHRIREFIGLIAQKVDMEIVSNNRIFLTGENVKEIKAEMEEYHGTK